MRNAPPDFTYWNRFPELSINECLMLLVNVEPTARVFYSRDDQERYKRIRRLLNSYRDAAQLPFVGDSVAPLDFVEWARFVGESIPDKWQPIGIERKPTAGTIEKGGPCWEEAGKAMKEMRDNPEIGAPRNLEQLYSHMLESENKDRFQNCCIASTELFNWESVKQRVYRERNSESKKNPLKEARFLNST